MSLIPGATQQVSVTGTMTDGSAAVALTVSWTASGGSVSPAGIVMAGSTIGAGWIRATSGRISSTIALTVVTPPDPPVVLAARSADDFVNSIGVNLHLGYWDTPYGTGYSAIIKPMLARLGIHHVRDAGTVVSDNAWMQSTYGRMADLNNQGIRFDLVMQPAQGSTDFATLGQWSRLMSYAAPVVESFEGLNEHDLSGRPNWVAETRSFQVALFAAVHGDARTSGMPVLGPSMGHPVNGGALGGLSSYMDLGNLHPYPGGRVPLWSLATHANYLTGVDGSHAYLVTETGYHTAVGSASDHPGVSEAAMARYIPRLFLDNFAAGVSRTYSYEFIDEGTTISEQEQNFGLLRHDGSAKPAFDALANLISILADPGSSFQPGAVSVVMGGDTSGVTRLALVKRDGRKYLVLWQDVTSYDLNSKASVTVAPKNVIFRFATAAQVRVFDPLLSPIAVTSQRVTSVVVPVTDTPLVIEITN